MIAASNKKEIKNQGTFCHFRFQNKNIILGHPEKEMVQCVTDENFSIMFTLDKFNNLRAAMLLPARVKN